MFHRFNSHVLAPLILIFLGLDQAISSSPSNLLQNSNIETNGPASWVTQVDSGTVAQTWATDRFVSNNHSLKTVVASSSASADWRQLVTGIDTLKKYRFRVHIYASNVSLGSHGAEMQWFDSHGAYLSTTRVVSSVANSWVEGIAESITPPPGADRVWILLRSYAAGTYYFDDPVFTRQADDVSTINGRFPIGLYEVPSSNLLKNSEFSLKGNCSPTPNGTGEDQNPLIWYKNVDSGSPVPSLSFDPLNKVVTITMGGSGSADWRQLVTEIDPSSVYQLQCSIKAGNVATGSHAAEIHWFNASNVYLGSNSYSSTLLNQWSNVLGQNIVPPPGSSKAYVMMRAYGQGTYSFTNTYLQVQDSSFGLTDLLDEIRDAGFNFLGFYQQYPSAQPFTLNQLIAADLKAACFLPADGGYSSIVNAVSSSPAIALWSQPDEAAWAIPQIPASALTAHYSAIVGGVDAYYASAPHRVWLNHAPRGLQSAPADFYASLSAYKDATDIVSMDIYPVPAGNGHSNLANQTVSSVGDYVDILVNTDPPGGQALQISGRNGIQEKPVWMALQGFGWQDHLLITDDQHTYDSHRVELHWFGGGVLLRADVFCSQIANQWFEVNVPDITPPSGADSLCILTRVYSPGTYYFDDIVLKDSNGINVVANSGAEASAGGLPANWSSQYHKWMPSLATPIFTWSNSQAKTGTQSLKVQADTCIQADWRQWVSGISPAKKYSLSAWINATSLKYERPTWSETRFMAYDAIINGARGILYYGTYFVPMRSQIWTDIKRITTELDSLSDVLIAPRSFRSVTTNFPSDVECLLLNHNGFTYLFMANKTAGTISSANVAITGLSLNSIEEVFDGSEPVLSANAFSVGFTPYQVRVYKLW